MTSVIFLVVYMISIVTLVNLNKAYECKEIQCNKCQECMQEGSKQIDGILYDEQYKTQDDKWMNDGEEE